jgi:hypothetical protein
MTKKIISVREMTGKEEREYKKLSWITYALAFLLFIYIAFGDFIGLHYSLISFIFGMTIYHYIIKLFFLDGTLKFLSNSNNQKEVK